jgi:GT2 family glycosyltransferase
VIPVKDDERLFGCLKALEPSAGAAAAVEIIVVDNGSENVFRSRLDELSPRVAVLDERRPGAFAARNRGVKAASGDVILFIDADCVPKPDWIPQALAALKETGADIVQGDSGTAAAPGSVGQLIQGRYGARFEGLRPGAPTECDTRNMAVRKRVFEELRFNADFRRVGDTEFGLLAESLGFRVGYAPEMRVDHDHDHRLDTFIAKQVCHGWGAQRLIVSYPDIRWHSGHLRFWASHMAFASRIRGRRAAGRTLARCVVAGARTLQRRRRTFPPGAVRGALSTLDKLGLLSGHLMYEPGAAEPAPSEFLGRQLRRE